MCPILIYTLIVGNLAWRVARSLLRAERAGSRVRAAGQAARPRAAVGAVRVSSAIVCSDIVA